MLTEDLSSLFSRDHNVCVVGSGPVGIVVALELARCGQAVTLVESGGMRADPDAQRLSEAICEDPARNVDMSLAVQRSFGGTSNLWGAGCVPLDPIDFEERPVAADAKWPISYREFAFHLAEACRYANCGQAFEHQLSLPVPDDCFTADRLIRYAEPASFRKAYRRAIAASRLITAYLGGTVTCLEFGEDGRVTSLRVQDRSGGEGVVRSKVTVLACGGVETARVLLVAQAEAPQRFGGENGPLGRYYMGHLSGSIADIEFNDCARDRSFNFFRPADAAYARRRITASAEFQKRENLTNISFWPTLPPMRDPGHRDPVLSLAYLVLSIPPVGSALVSESLRRLNVGDGSAKREHLANVVGGLPTVAGFLPKFLYGRFLASRRLPGLHLSNGARRYTLQYHAEHLPNPESRIRLSTHRDALGMRRAILDLRFSESDVEPVVRTHAHLAEWLTRTGLGRLSWHQAQHERGARVMDLAGDGVHQVGTARMAETSRHGVVDRDCRVFGSNNLFVAGSAVFPSSGQANPTLSAMALAIRQARLVAAEAGSR